MRIPRERHPVRKPRLIEGAVLAEKLTESMSKFMFGGMYQTRSTSKIVSIDTNVVYFHCYVSDLQDSISFLLRTVISDDSSAQVGNAHISVGGPPFSEF